MGTAYLIRDSEIAETPAAVTQAETASVGEDVGSWGPRTADGSTHWCSHLGNGVVVPQKIK